MSYNEIYNSSGLLTVNNINSGYVESNYSTVLQNMTINQQLIVKGRVSQPNATYAINNIASAMPLLEGGNNVVTYDPIGTLTNTGFYMGTLSIFFDSTINFGTNVLIQFHMSYTDTSNIQQSIPQSLYIIPCNTEISNSYATSFTFYSLITNPNSGIYIGQLNIGSTLNSGVAITNLGESDIELTLLQLM